jgi:hypothetical protein
MVYIMPALAKAENQRNITSEKRICIDLERGIELNNEKSTLLDVEILRIEMEPSEGVVSEKRPTELGQILRQIRIELDENIIDMAKKLRVSCACLSDIEFGGRVPSDLIVKMQRVYNLHGKVLPKLVAIAKKQNENISMSQVPKSQSYDIVAYPSETQN